MNTRELRKKPDPKQRARRAVYRTAAQFLDVLGGKMKARTFQLPDLLELASAAECWKGGRAWWGFQRDPDVDAIRAACRFVADELFRRSKGRGPYDKATTVIRGRVHKKRTTRRKR